MNPSDMVFDAVYKGALKRGAVDRHANDQAVIAVEDYRKNKFKKVSHLIEEKTNMAVKLSKGEGK